MPGVVEEKIIVLFDLVGDFGTEGAKLYEERNEEKLPIFSKGMVLSQNQFNRLGQPQAVHAVIEAVL